MSTAKDCKSNFSDILTRLLQVSGKTHEYEIAGMLGFKKDSFAARKSRGSIPEKEIKLACVSNGWSFKWVMTGEGELSAVVTAVQEPAHESYAGDQKELLLCWEKMGEIERMALLICARAMAQKHKA
jgi:hypothetical protein